MRRLLATSASLAALALLALALPAGAATSPARAEAMAKLAPMQGVWRGPATGVGRDGQPFTITQTERVGPMLDGDLLVVEGRGYAEDGAVKFNAFGAISWDEMTKKYEFRAYAQGYGGTYELKLTDKGYVWEVPAGPGNVLRYTASFAGGTWHEVGEFIAGAEAPRQMFEMTLTRIGETDWPGANPVPAK
jgi:hypothetical protein